VRSGAILGIAAVLAAIWIGCGEADSDAPEGPTPAEATPAREAEAQAVREAPEQREVEAEVREEERQRKKEAAKAGPAPDSSGGKFTGAQAKRYQEDREICGLFPSSQIAKEYGLPASADLVSIAEAYADGYQPQFHQAAFEGCLDGLGS
jgi:hypothetical protein